jgi:hypothetical protein
MGERGHTPSRGVPCQYLAGEGSTSSAIVADKHRVARDARPVPGGASLRGKLRCVHRAAKERYTYNPRRSPIKRKPTSTAELRIDLAYLSSDLKYSNALPLRLRAACVSHALHPTDEFDAPSVRKDTQPENTRVQPPQGVPTFYLASIEPAHLDACVCVRAWFKMGRSKSGSRVRVLRVCWG